MVFAYMFLDMVFFIVCLFAILHALQQILYLFAMLTANFDNEYNKKFTTLVRYFGYVVKSWFKTYLIKSLGIIILGGMALTAISFCISYWYLENQSIVESFNLKDYSIMSLKSGVVCLVIYDALKSKHPTAEKFAGVCNIWLIIYYAMNFKLFWPFN